MLRPTERDAWRTHAMGTATAVEVVAGHSEHYRPLGGYLVLVGAFNALAAGGLVAAARAGRLPDTVRASDPALGAVATYTLSRLISRDRVTSAIRAPFTRFQEDAGHGEVEEAARGTGLRLAVGELLVCPNCLGAMGRGRVHRRTARDARRRRDVRDPRGCGRAAVAARDGAEQDELKPPRASVAL